MKGLKAFIKPFEASQRSVKVKIQFLFQCNFKKCTGRQGLTTRVVDLKFERVDSFGLIYRYCLSLVLLYFPSWQLPVQS